MTPNIREVIARIVHEYIENQDYLSDKVEILVGKDMKKALLRLHGEMFARLPNEKDETDIVDPERSISRISNKSIGYNDCLKDIRAMWGAEDDKN